MEDQEYVDWCHEVLEKATEAQASVIMDLRAAGWRLADAIPYQYEDELETDPPRGMLYALQLNKKTLVVNSAGRALIKTG